MAIHKRTYRAYSGELRPVWVRFLVIPRFAFLDLFATRKIPIFLALSGVPPLVAAIVVYLHHNPSALGLLALPLERLVVIDAKFFLYLLNIQGFAGFLLTVMVGPGLVSSDLAGNALPAYFCRPFSRLEYVAGKACVLAGLLSVLTWIPMTLVVFLQGSLAEDWLIPNRHILEAVFLGSWVWIALFSSLSLAISAWVRWRPVAGATLLGVFLVLPGFGGAINRVADTDEGTLLNLRAVVSSVNSHLFGVESWSSVEVEKAWAVLGVTLLVCWVLLNRKLRAYEVVR